MRPNNIRTVWNAGQCVVNGWLAIPSAFSAEVMAHCGWDSLCIDIQHGMVDYQTATTMMQAISTTAVTPIVRVPWNDPAIIMKCLDAGAYGIVCPMINSGEDALRFAGACRYPPMGYRSLGPIRAQLYGGSDYAAKANEEIVALAMIETMPGLEIWTLS
jgi:4-hydroxy-2-oxoheptanedioate aldolase